jgi:arsenite-transporting ATPase
MLEGLDKIDLKLILFGGKGGVGKTTIAAATAIELAEKYQTLLISTDPAHSISDSLEQPIGYKLQKIKGVNNLSAIEIAADEAFEEFKKQHKAEIEALFDTSSNLDKEDINQLLGVSIPGVDEIMGIKTIIDLIQEGEFEKYVVDTAPTGHALRLLASPEILDQWIKVAVQMRWKYRYMITSFSGRYQPDATDDMLLELKKKVKQIETLLHNKQKSEFIPVCIPESMAVKETERLLSDLRKHRIPVRHLLMNNVMKLGTCEFCIRQQKFQQKYLEQIRKIGGQSCEIIQVPLLPEEIRGLESLNALRKILFSPNYEKSSDLMNQMF